MGRMSTPDKSLTPASVARIRKALKLSRSDLAKRLGVSRMTIWRWENGITPQPVMQRLLVELKETHQ